MLKRRSCALPAAPSVVAERIQIKTSVLERQETNLLRRKNVMSRVLLWRAGDRCKFDVLNERIGYRIMVSDI